MRYGEATLERIDFTDETFRISEDLECEMLEASLREVGLVHPVLLLDRGEKYRIVCGFRRLHALRRLKRSEASAGFFEDPIADSREIFDLALWDNLSHRSLTPLETARVVHGLKNVFGVPDRDLVETYLPRLGLPAHERSIRLQLELHASIPEIRKCFGDGRLTAASLECLSAMSTGSKRSIASAMQAMRLSSSLQRKFFALLEDLGAMHGSEPGELLADSRITDILGDGRMSPGERGDGVYDLLYRRRYPLLSRARDLFLERKKALGLPEPVQVHAAPYFEKPDLTVGFTVTDAKGFRKVAEELHKASLKPELDDLFRVVD